ncbi:MAG TPA: hypothetical protein PKD09_09290 [Aggregatilinea sp.]|uniref:hypothetical protein n=1 Tax=Aggregatilinea sp. TaxID=2806333 RepID=UPI002B6811D7|nr:hypothetical protein [Aggregatilinea sp.]HML21830.1 hypothetical protein [Aggregatilinea sp.]
MPSNNPFADRMAVNRQNLIRQQQERAAARQTAPVDPTRRVLLADLHVDERVQVRQKGLSQGKVEEYAQAMIAYGGWGEFPALEVVEVDGRLVIADGMHRNAGAHLANTLAGMMLITEVPVIVRPGGLWEAFVYGAERNIRHGQPLTKADKMHYLTVRMSEDAPEELSWRGLSARAIAPLLGVSDKTVSAWLTSVAENSATDTVQGTDGKTYRRQRKRGRAAMTEEEKAQRAVVKGLGTAADALDELGRIHEAKGYRSDADKYSEEWDL